MSPSRRSPRESASARSPSSQAARSTRRDLYLGLEVVEWISQETVAAYLGLTTRWVRVLESKGLPAEGHHNTTRYAIPHAVIWWRQWQLAEQADEKLRKLPFATALARHAHENAIEDAEIELRRRTDALYDAWMAASLTDDVARAEALLVKLWERDGVPEGAEKRMGELIARGRGAPLGALGAAR